MPALTARAEPIRKMSKRMVRSGLTMGGAHPF
jgi:hypothetical protein